MYPLTDEVIEAIFNSIVSSLKGQNKKAITVLNEIRPSQHEKDSLEWRLKLEGYIKGLQTTGTLSDEDHQIAYSALYPDRQIHDGENDRPGRDHKYTVLIVTTLDNNHSFDVAAMNPLDAYVQLTKRVAYKSIPDIVKVSVYEGFGIDATDAHVPVRQFDHSELIHTRSYL